MALVPAHARGASIEHSCAPAAICRLKSCMNLEDFIGEALCQPTDVLAYHVSRKLAKLCPDKEIIEGESYHFDLEAFVLAGRCTVVRDLSVHLHRVTEWRGAEQPFRHEWANGWFDVLWQGQLLEVLLLTFHEDGCKSRHHWIVADTTETAEGFLADVCGWNAEVRGEVLVFTGGGWLKDKKLYEAIQAATFDNLILPAELKRELQTDFAQFFAARATYERYGVPWKRGALLTGPPGNGKTHTVKALINQLRQPCLYVKSFKSRYQTEHGNIRAVFARARQAAPCLLVFEDLDALIDDKNRAYFLNELDGFAANTGVVVLATTNYPERLDPAIIDRPSRFDRKYYFAPPAHAERLAYLRTWHDALNAEMRLSDAGLAEVVAETEGFSFAYLKELFMSSMMQWMSAPQSRGMEAVMRERVPVLRAQMSQAQTPPKKVEDDETDDDE